MLIRLVYRFRLALVALVAVAVVAVGRTGSFAAGGADSYGYLSEALLWLEGDLHVRQDVMQAAPWPGADATFTPLGYELSPKPFFIVPVHAPGLPLLMAGAALVGGWCAVFWVVPLTGGVLVLATYAIGARIGRPIVGLSAAVLVAASPAVLYMLVQPMSDLPSAAAFATGLALVLGRGRLSAFAAGLMVGLGILIRPNLVPLAIPFGLFTLYQDATARPLEFRAFRTPWLVASTAIGIGIEAAINNQLYGSPFRSGYGRLNYQAAHIWPNIAAYGGWLVSTHTPIALAGLAALALPARSIWRTTEATRALWFFTLYAGAVVGPFLLFQVPEAWWYLRYLLPLWPLLMIGTAAVLSILFRVGRPWARLTAIGALVALVWFGWYGAERRAVFEVRAGEQKYIDAARLVGERVDARAAILSVQHSGSVRHYAGLMTIRWDRFAPGTLDDAVDWLYQTGRHPYLLVEPWEVEYFRNRYGGEEAGRLDWEPVLTIRAASEVYLYDLVNRTSHPDGAVTFSTHGRPMGDRCVMPAAAIPANW